MQHTASVRSCEEYSKLPGLCSMPSLLAGQPINYSANLMNAFEKLIDKTTSEAMRTGGDIVILETSRLQPPINEQLARIVHTVDRCLFMPSTMGRRPILVSCNLLALEYRLVV